jgi:glutathione S-transferase
VRAPLQRNPREHQQGRSVDAGVRRHQPKQQDARQHRPRGRRRPHEAKDDYLAGAYSIADIAAWPWVVRYDWQGQDLNDYPNVKRWFEAVGARPAVQTGADVGKDLHNFSQPLSDEDRKRLFNLP